MNEKMVPIVTTLRKQKLVQLLLFCCLLLPVALTAQTVTLNLKKVPVQMVFKEISRQTNISIVYNESMFADFAPVTINVKNAPVKDVLNTCFKNQPFTYEMDGNSIIIKKTDKPVAAQPDKKSQVVTSVSVTGVVLNAKGEPVEGATVELKSKGSTGTFTNMKGEFAFRNIYPDKYTLKISSLNYEKTERTINATKDSVSLSVVLKDAIDNSQKEVVVNGLFSRPKENFTGASSSFTGDQLREVNPTNVLQALKSLDASFQVPVDNINGSNPNILPRFQVRGTNSILQNDLTSEYGYISNPPLIILNGFEIPVQQFVDLDINTIARITILKDAAATAIYGSKSANGVLVIETKRPKPGEVMMTYTGNYTMNMPDLSSFNLMDAQEKINFERVAGVYKNRDPQTQKILTDKYNLVLQNVQKGVNTYWLSQPLQTEYNHAHSIIVGAGSNKVSYMAQLNYSKNGGVMKGSNRNNLGGNLQMNYYSGRFKAQWQFFIGSTTSNNSPYGSFSTYALLNPYWTIRNPSGNISKYVDDYYPGEVNGVPVSLPYTFTPQVINPLYNTTLHTVDKSSDLTYGQNIWTELELLRGLKFTGTFSFTNTRSQSDKFLPGTASQFFTESDFSRRGSYDQGTSKSQDLQSNILANYGRSFGKHTLFATGGINLQQTTNQSLNISTRGFASERLDDLLFGLEYTDDKPSGSYAQKRTVGFLGNTSYAYDNRYLMDLSYRTDGSSVFGVNKRFGNFWSAGLGWNLHNEKFFQLPKVINRMKLRGSYGFTGAITFPGYASATSYQYITTGRYLDFIPATIIALGNPDLLWQRTRKLNLGTDISLFKDRVTMNIDYYVETTDDLIMSNPSPPSTGFNSFYNNLGKSVNKGYSISLSAFIIKNPAKNIFWSVTTSWYANKNKLVKIEDVLRQQNQKALDTIQKGYTKPVLQYEEGKSVSTLYAVRSLGIDPATGREIYLTKDGRQTFIWNVKDMVALGDMQPRFNATLNNHLQIKWLKLDFALNIVLGGLQYNTTLADKYENADNTKNVDRRALENRWQKPGDQQQYKGLTDVEGYPILNMATQATSRFVRKNNAISLTGLSLDPGRLLSKYITRYTNLLVNKINDKAKNAIKSDAIDVRFVMNNVFTNLFGTQREVGTAYPINRTYTLNLILHL